MKRGNHMEKIYFLDHIDEYREFRSFVSGKGLKTSDFHLIALHPKVRALLAAEGVAHEGTLGYFDNRSHLDIITATETVMEYLRKEFDFQDSNGLRETYINELSSYIRSYLNYFFKIVLVLERVASSRPGADYYGVLRRMVYDTPLIGAREGYAGALAQRFASVRGFRFTNVSEGVDCLPVRGRPTGITPFFEACMNSVILFAVSKKRTIWFHLIEDYVDPILRAVCSEGRDIVGIALASDASFKGKLAHNLRRFFTRGTKGGMLERCFMMTPNFAGVHASRGDRARLAARINMVLGPEMERMCSFRGVDCFDLLKFKVLHALLPHLESLLDASYNLRYAFNGRYKPVVVSTFGIGAITLAGEAARSFGSKSVFISHGSHPEPVDEYHEIELLNLCRLFMLGPFTDVTISTPMQESHIRYFKNKYPGIRNNEILTGPLIFADITPQKRREARIRLGIGTEEFVLIHATTVKTRISERFHFLETPDEFIDSLADVVRAADSLERVRLIIRLHPKFCLTDDELRRLLPASSRYIIHRDGMFEEALAAADLMVSYSSTAIDEALINRVPVLLFDKWARYNHLRAPVFDGRGDSSMLPVCYVNSSAMLRGAVDHIRGEISTGCMRPEMFERYRLPTGPSDGTEVLAANLAV